MTTLLDNGHGVRRWQPSDLLALRDAMGLPVDAAATHRPPWGEALLGVSVLSPRGELVAALAALRCILPIRGKDIGLGVVRVAWVAPAYRVGGGHSLLRELDQAFASACEGDNASFQAVLGRFAEVDLWWLRAHRGYMPVGSSVRFKGRVVGSHDGVVDAVSVSTEALAALSGPWDSPLRLDNRFIAELLAERGTTSVAALKNGAPRAWLQCRVEGDVARILHFGCDEDFADVRGLFARVADGREIVMDLTSPGELVLTRLQDAGLFVHGPEFLVAGRVTKKGLCPASLSDLLVLTDAIVGESALPRLSVGEAVVTPPPSGTHWHEEDRRL